MIQTQYVEDECERRRLHDEIVRLKRKLRHTRDDIVELRNTMMFTFAGTGEQVDTCRVGKMLDVIVAEIWDV